MSELAPTIRIMPKPIWGLQAALQTRHTWLSLLSEKCAKEWERSGWLPKQAPHHYFCVRAKETGVDKTALARASQQHQPGCKHVLQGLEGRTLDLHRMARSEK